jgi:8-amino-7-oxononanoate synthase
MATNAQAETIPTEAEQTGGGGAHSVEAIETWLIAKLADLLAMDAGEIDPDQHLSVYGLSSMTGVMLTGDIEDWLGVRLEPTLAWEYPTVRSLARYLADEQKGAAGGTA